MTVKPVGFTVDISRLNTKKGTHLGRGTLYSVLEFADSILPANHETAVLETPSAGLKSWFETTRGWDGFSLNPSDLYLLAIPELKKDPALYQHILQIQVQHQITGNAKKQEEGFFQSISKWVLEECAAIFFKERDNSPRKKTFDFFCENNASWLNEWCEASYRQEEEKLFVNQLVKKNRFRFYQYLQFLCFEQNQYVFKQLSSKRIKRIVSVYFVKDQETMSSQLNSLRQYGHGAYFPEDSLNSLLQLEPEDRNRWLQEFGRMMLKYKLSLWLPADVARKYPVFSELPCQMIRFAAMENEYPDSGGASYDAMIDQWSLRYNILLSKRLLQEGRLFLTKALADYCSHSVRSAYQTDVMLIHPGFLKCAEQPEKRLKIRLSEQQNVRLHSVPSSKWMNADISEFFRETEILSGPSISSQKLSLIQGQRNAVHLLSAAVVNRDVCFFNSRSQWQIAGDQEKKGKRVFYEMLLENLTFEQQDVCVEMSQTLSGRSYGRLGFRDLMTGEDISFSVRQLNQEGLKVRLKAQQIIHFLIFDEAEMP